DVLLLPVGGGPKAYNAEEAAQVVQTLRPKLVIPTHYLTQAADEENCPIATLDEFLSLMQGIPVSRANGDTVTLGPSSLPAEGTRIQLLSYPF
ncbi:Zn-dependent hydrolase, partial [filamentous cyanobacterium CCP5]